MVKPGDEFHGHHLQYLSRSSSREVRTRVPNFFRTSMLVNKCWTNIRSCNSVAKALKYQPWNYKQRASDHAQRGMHLCEPRFALIYRYPLQFRPIRVADLYENNVQGPGKSRDVTLAQIYPNLGTQEHNIWSILKYETPMETNVLLPCSCRAPAVLLTRNCRENMHFKSPAQLELKLASPGTSAHPIRMSTVKKEQIQNRAQER